MIKTKLVTPLASLLLIGSTSITLMACSNMDHADQPAPIQAASAKLDGDISVPEDYRSWPKFVPTVDKPNGQVREIYINQAGLNANKGERFPAGTITVMELYSPKQDNEGNPIKDAKGRLIKDKLDKIFVMEKGENWGNQLPSTVINNGDWLYGAYLADGSTPATQDYSGCRGCHAPLAENDFIHRYDEHFTHK